MIVTLVDYGANRLRMLCRGAGFGEETERVVATFRQLLTPWGEALLGERSGWVSDIGDDHSPIEFSVAIVDGQPEVRVLMEAQAEEPTIAAYRRAGLAFNKRLETEFGADLRRLRLVEDVFLPEDMRGAFAVWNAVCFSPGQAPTFKVYLNPQARGIELAHALTEKALVSLGFDRAFGALGCKATRRGPQLDEIKYFALDLCASREARVKVYVHHHRATAEHLEVACSAARDHVPGEAREFTRAMTLGTRLLAHRSPFTCSSFVTAGDERPAAVTLYIPVCAYARDDSVIRGRVEGYLRSRGVDSSLYGRILDNFAHRSLDAGVGMQSWVALRHGNRGPRITIYLSTESNYVFRPGSVPAPTADPLALESAEAVIRRVARDDLRDHPFLRRLMREDVNASFLWLLIANAYEGTSKHFVRWLASVTAVVDDERMRCQLARRLNEEMGDGDYTRSRGMLLRTFLDGIQRWRPDDFKDDLLAAGRLLGKRLEKHYMSAQAYEGLGALMAGEICAHQLVDEAAHLMRRLPTNVMSPVAAQWLGQHDGTEGERAPALAELGRLVPPDRAKVEAVLRGAVGIHRAIWLFLDEMYSMCFAPSSQEERESASPGVASAPLSFGHEHGPASAEPPSSAPASLGPMSLGPMSLGAAGLAPRANVDPPSFAPSSVVRSRDANVGQDAPGVTGDVG